MQPAAREAVWVSRVNPPFRADHVGSLLRYPRLKEARERFQKNDITRDELRAVEDDAIREVVRKQEAIGLQGIAATFHTREGDIDFAPPRIMVTGKLRHVQDIQTEDFRFLKSVATRTPKVTIPSPPTSRAGSRRLPGTCRSSIYA
jgi:5-methyltetrahydropteroyltriglutamate--homocysteine methyltransferase